MRREKFLEVFHNLPTKRKQVLLGILRGDTREKIMADVGLTQDALTQHRRQLYKAFQIEVFQNEADDPRSGERKLPQLIALCAQYQPELISPNTDRVSPARPESLLFPNFSTYNPQTWVGRELIVEGLLPKLQGQTRLLWIKGISGIGKTALGECLASKAWEKEPSFQWIYLEILEGQSPDFASVAADLLAKLGARELDPQERNNSDRLAKRLLQKLQSHPYWIQMDSLERLLNPEQPNQFVDAYWATFLQRFLTDSNVLSRLVLTAQALPTELAEFDDRYPNTWAEHRLDGLLQVEQLEFFAKRGVLVEPSKQDILTRIAKIYEGHPLVLKVIAEDILQEFAGDVSRYWQIYQPEFEQVARELQATRLDETEYNEALDRKVRERIKKSLEQLPADALDLLCRSAVFRRPVPKKFWLAMIGDRSSQQQKVAYRVLGDRTLIEKEGTDIRQHNLIRDIAYHILKGNLNIWKSSEYKASEQWLTAYKPDLNASNLDKIRGYLESFHHYCEVEAWQQAGDILLISLDTPVQRELYWMLGVWGFYREEIQLCSRILGKCSSELDGVLLNTLGNAHKDLCQYQQAAIYLQQRLMTARETGDRQGEGQSLGNLGLVYCAFGDYEQAIAYHQESLAISREIGDNLGEGRDLGNIGFAYCSQGKYEQAIIFSQQYLAIAREAGDREGEGKALGNLGNVHLSLGSYEQAIIYLQEGLIIAREIGDRMGEGIRLCNLGEIFIKTKQFSEALLSLQDSLNIASEIGDREGEAYNFKNLAMLYYQMTQITTAQKYCDKALQISTELQIPLASECEDLQLNIENKKLKMEETQP